MKTLEENLLTENVQEVGPFGPVYRQFAGKAADAISFLLQKGSGEAVGALHHKDVGNISIVYGNCNAVR